MDDSTTPAGGPSGLKRAALILVGATAVGLGIFAVGRLLQRSDDPPGPTAPPSPVAKGGSKERPPVPRNAQGDVGYVGVQACAACHEGQYATYLKTQHGRSFSRADPTTEPIPATFTHASSGITYDIREVDGVLRMSETLTLKSGAKEVLADHDVPYLIGSGTHSRSYICELDGFLVEAPATYYASRKAWDVSPGYDRVIHFGFKRPIGARCMDCHVGHIEPAENAVHKMRILEDAIGCERCHGPGELHATLQGGPNAPPRGTGKPDDTIVTPTRLTRGQQIDLCAQCHMDHTLTVMHPDKSFLDWKPGMPWSDVQTTFRPATPSNEMTVVGHVDQMRASRCFQASDTMTCLTCHDPHHREPEGTRQQWFNNKCMGCHDACARTPEEGADPVPPHGDDCVSCHMPAGDTDIPHIAFHHHRIGIHAKASDAPPPVKRAPPSTLVPLQDDTHLPVPVRERNRGLAYLQLLGHVRDPGLYKEYARRAIKALQTARAAGYEEAEQMAALGRLDFDGRRVQKAAVKLRRALELAKTQKMTPDTRASALSILADVDFGMGKPKEAMARLRTLATMRRESNDWKRIAVVAQALDDKEGARMAARKALDIWPNDSNVQFEMAGVLEWAGEVEEARRHNLIGEFIQIQQSIAPPK